MGLFSGQKPWTKREELAGDRLPYAALLDENVVLLRDGSVHAVAAGSRAQL